MIRTLFSLVFVSIFAAACGKHIPLPGKPHNNPTHHLKAGLNTIINKYTALGIPGIQVSVYDGDGWYSGAAGYANVETSAPLKPDSTTWIFSITKSYTAALILMSRDKQLLNLDRPITEYLNANTALSIKNSEKITVRQLLNHSSGIVNFIELDEFLARQFANPLLQPTNAEILAMLKDKDVLFEPGTNTYYSNSNYLLLQIILEKVNGQSYASLLRSKILEPLNLPNTWIEPSAPLIESLGFPDYYADLNNSGSLQNVTAWNSALGKASGGWGGIAARPTEVIRFYQALVAGKVISKASLAEMQQYVGDYGLGIESYKYSDGRIQFGHEGDGVGNSTMILFIPKSDAFVFINCTTGRQLPTPYLNKIIDAKNEINEYVITNAK